MKYAEALEKNGSCEGLDLRELPLDSLIELIEDIPSWDYPLGEESVLELARRAKIDVNVFFDEADRDYSDLWLEAAEKLGVNI